MSGRTSTSVGPACQGNGVENEAGGLCQVGGYEEVQPQQRKCSGSGFLQVARSC